MSGGQRLGAMCPGMVFCNSTSQMNNNGSVHSFLHINIATTQQGTDCSGKQAGRVAQNQGVCDM